MKALLLAPMGSVHRRFNSANIKALQSLGYEVHLAGNFERGAGPERQNPEYAQQCNASGVKIHSIPYQRHSLKGNLQQVQETKKLLANERFDLVHAHTETGGLILRLAGKAGLDTKYLYTPHGMSFYQGGPLKAQLLYRPVERFICAGMDTNIAINQEEYGVLDRWNRKTAVLVHGIGLDISRFERPARDRAAVRTEMGIPMEARVVLSVGELDDNKNHRVVLEALASLKRGDVYYAVCGVGPNRETLAAQAKTLGVADRLILAGYRKDIPDIIHASDVFAFPSHHEGLPVALMEAMGGGLPVVCSKIRGNVDLIRNGVNGFLADPDDGRAWAEALDKLLTRPDLRSAMAEKGREALKPYLREAVYEELRRLYGTDPDCG